MLEEADVNDRTHATKRIERLELLELERRDAPSPLLLMPSAAQADVDLLKNEPAAGHLSLDHVPLR